MRLFTGLERAHGIYFTAKKHTEGKVKGRASTKTEPITVALWEQHLRGEQGLGIVPIMDDNRCWWAAVDIDTYPLDLVALERKASDMRLPMVVLRSKSGGGHLVLFTAEPIKASYLRAKLTQWAVLLGYPGVEIFPKQDELHSNDDVGNWLNMPYFEVEQTLRPAIFKGEEISAEDFLSLAEGRRVTRQALDDFLVPSTEDFFIDGPPCLQTLAKQGFPRGSRNKGLFNIGVFARFAHGDDWQSRVDEFNRRYMNPPLSSSEVMSTVKSLGRKNYFYTCSQDPIASVCNRTICRTRKFGIGNNDNQPAPVMIGSITKIDSNPPVYEVEVDTALFECSSDDLLSQTRFRKLCFESLNRMIPIIKESSWATMINEKMEDMKNIEAPDDAGPEGQFFNHLESFCTSRVTAASLDEILLGKPFVDNEKHRTYFRSMDLIHYLESQHFREFNERRIFAALRRRGCQHEWLHLKGKHVIAWSIPSHQTQTDGHEPRIIEGDEM